MRASKNGDFGESSGHLQLPMGSASSICLTGLLISAVILGSFVVSPALAMDVLPGVDIWTTPPGGATVDSHFTVMSIPPDFFGPGSDPFDQPIALTGDPLGPIWPTDAIVERLDTAFLPACGDSDVVPIRIVALSLVSIQPITVTYDGGTTPEPWDVHACLSSVDSQFTGWMTIHQDCPEGGRFEATLPVTPRFKFIRQADQTERILDMGSYLTIPFETQNGDWLHYDPGFDIYESDGTEFIDHDCNLLTPDVPIGASSGNFYAGLRAFPCECGEPVQEHRKHLTREEAQLAAHGVLPTEPPGPDSDADGIHDVADNCPDIPNPLQLDRDDDCSGDDCDNCPDDPNWDQKDSDSDGIGDVCDDCLALIGDADWSGGLDIDDVVYLINYIFASGPPPIPYSAASGDADCNCFVDIDDAVYLINFIFLGGPPPPCSCEGWVLDCGQPLW